MGKMDDLMRELDAICEEVKDVEIDDAVDSERQHSSDNGMKTKMNVTLYILENTKNLTREDCIDVFGGISNISEELLRRAVLAPSDKFLNENLEKMEMDIREHFNA